MDGHSYDPRWTHQPPHNAPLTTLQPYLLLSHRLSLTWLAYPLISLLFIAFRLFLSSASAQDAISNAKGNLLVSCKAAEEAASSTASLPRYMALASNQQFADSVNSVINGSRGALILSLDVMEGILNFLIDTYYSTFFCFIELLIRGTLEVVLSVTKEISDAIQVVSNTIRTTVLNNIDGVNTLLRNTINGINNVIPFGITKITVPTISPPDLSALENVQLSNTIQNALSTANSSIPSVQELKDKLEELIAKPFELVKQEINETFNGITFSSNVLAVPDRSPILFCQDLDTSIVDDLSRDLRKFVIYGAFLLAGCALLLVVGNFVMEWLKWRSLNRQLNRLREGWTTDPSVHHGGTEMQGTTPTLLMTDHNLLVFQATMSNPLLTVLCNKLAKIFKLTPSQFIHLQWFFNYIFYPPALACLLIGLFGVISIEVQIFLIGFLQGQYKDRAAASVANFSNSIVTAINANMQNQSSLYATGVNGRVDRAQTTINDGIFGWVNTTTFAVNHTIATFYDDIERVVGGAVKGTPLENSINNFLFCILGSKVEAIERAIAFLRENLRVDMPRLDTNVLLLPSDSVDEIARPIAAAAIGGGQDDDQGLVGRLLGTYVNSLKHERLVFCIFLGLWGLVVIMALAIIAWHSYGPPAKRLRDGRPAEPAFTEKEGTSSFIEDDEPKESWLARLKRLLAAARGKVHVPALRRADTGPGLWDKSKDWWASKNLHMPEVQLPQVKLPTSRRKSEDEGSVQSPVEVLRPELRIVNRDSPPERRVLAPKWTEPSPFVTPFDDDSLDAKAPKIALGSHEQDEATRAPPPPDPFRTPFDNDALDARANRASEIMPLPPPPIITSMRFPHRMGTGTARASHLNEFYDSPTGPTGQRDSLASFMSTAPLVRPKPGVMRSHDFF